jgi:hypothetical protein
MYKRAKMVAVVRGLFGSVSIAMEARTVSDTGPGRAKDGRLQAITVESATVAGDTELYPGRTVHCR